MSGKIGYLFAFATALIVLAAPATADVKLFLLGGQSNMQGMGGFPGATYGSTYYPPDDPCPSPYNAVQTTVKFWDYGTPSGGENRPETVGNGWVDLQPGFGWYPSEFGPEVSLGYALSQKYPNDQIYLVKYAKGASTLVADWRPDGTGECYNWFQKRVDAALKSLSGSNPVIAGMIWMQGEGDAKTTAAANAYGQNLTNLIAKVRSDFATPDMPFVIGRISDYYLSRVGGATVRTAQMNVANLDENVSWFSTDELEYAYVGHFGTQGQIDLGNLFAAEFPSPTPEPAALVLTTTGMLVLAGWRRRK